MRPLFRWSGAVAWMAVIFLFSSLPDLRTGLPSMWEVILRILAHAAEFGVLAFLFLLALRQSTRRAVLWSFVLTVLYALTDEWHQSFVSGRVASGWDVVVDAAGAILTLTGRPLFR